MVQDNLSTNVETDDLARQKLDLLQALDDVRDTSPEGSLLSNTLKLLTEWFEAACGVLFLLNHDTGQLEIAAVDYDANQKDAYKLFRTSLGQHALELNRLEVWTEDYLQTMIPSLESAEWHVCAIPIQNSPVDKQGSLLIGRSGRDFSETTCQLLEIAETRLDSVISQHQTYIALQAKIKELESVYAIDKIRDLDLPLDPMLNRILEHVMKSMSVDCAFISLYEKRSRSLEMRASAPARLVQLPENRRRIEEISNGAIHGKEMQMRQNVTAQIGSIITLPLFIKNRPIAVIGIINDPKSRKFDAADQRMLHSIGTQVDSAIFESQEKRRLRQVLGRSVGHEVMETMLANGDSSMLNGIRREVTVLYADLRGSTKMAETTQPEMMVAFLNYYLETMTEIALAYSGTIDKFIGDEIMVLFNVPIEQHDHALRAVRVALRMQSVHEAIREMWRKHGLEPGQIGIGIATGEMIVGEIGSLLRSDYTAVGQAANIGARIQDRAKGGQILIDQTTYAHISHRIDASTIPNQKLHGIDFSMNLYDVKGINF